MNYSLREIAELLEMPESTLRLYRDEFEEFVSARGEGRRRRYDEAALQVLRDITGWKKAAWKSEAIRDALKKQKRPESQARRRTSEDRLDELMVLVRAQSEQIAQLRVEIGQLRAGLSATTPEPLTWDEALRAGQGGEPVV
jgi:DNA-binding transcriptional MerR regulator